MRKLILFFAILLMFIGVIWVILFYWLILKGAKPAIQPPPANIADIIESIGQNDTDFPLKLPLGFTISIFAKDLNSPRVMAFGPGNALWVSQPKAGNIITLLVENNQVIDKKIVYQDLNNPHGIVFDPQDSFIIYIAEEDKVSKARIDSGLAPEKIIDLPTGGRHTSRTLLFGPDSRLYVSIGSSCDVCYEDDERRAAIYVMDKDGGNFELHASGLRNSVFMAIEPIYGKIWATEMGRDYLGDDLPPDEINIIEQGKNYGWPICYGKNIHDTKFDLTKYEAHPCYEPNYMPSFIDIPAHSAPLGLAFVPEKNWPEDYWLDLIIAYHGSWNRSEPTGYKIVRMKLDDQRNFLGTEDFITGWLTEDNQALGRPVDILIRGDGSMYISDDKAGVIYKVVYVGN